jgi:hypothetical protein
MEPILQRKPRQHFDTASQPSHVTFDDGIVERRSLPWTHFSQARWEYQEPDTIRIEIGDVLVVLAGKKLELLFAAIEERTLLRVRAQPLLATQPDRKDDAFVTSIRFLKAPSNKGNAPGLPPIQSSLGLA